MARSFLTPVNLNRQELQNATIANLGTAPTSPNPGLTYFDTTVNYTLTFNGTIWVDPRARANHSGSQGAATISDLASTVGGYSRSVFGLPTGNIPMGGFTLTGLAQPTAAGQAAEYSWVVSQVQSAASGISSKDPVTVVATTNIASLSGTQTVDGVPLVAGNRVLLSAQTTASQNGPWVVASGAWTRPVTEGGGTAELDLGAMWLATQGTVGAGTQWRMSTVGAITLGTTSVGIVQFGAGAAYTAGNGIALNGNAFAVNPVAAGGILVASGGVSLDTAVAVRKFSQTIGDGSTASFVVTHSLGTQDVQMQVRQTANPWGFVECDTFATSTTTATISFSAPPAANAYRVSIFG